MAKDPAMHGAPPVASVAGEHAVQTALLRALGDGVRARQDPAQIRALLRQLVEYSDAHFQSEQQLMRLCSYPEYDDHVLDHDRMMDALRGMAARDAEHSDSLDPGEMDDLTQFLLRHIETRDRRFTDYYQGWIDRAADPAARAPEAP